MIATVAAIGAHGRRPPARPSVTSISVAAQPKGRFTTDAIAPMATTSKAKPIQRVPASPRIAIPGRVITA